MAEPEEGYNSGVNKNVVGTISSFGQFVDGSIASQTGAIISQASLTLSASSQALPTPPTGAVRALLQTHGGTVTDRIYVSLDGNDATTADFFMKNVEDTTANIGGPTELIVAGNLEDVRVLGTSNASIMIIWWFK